MNVSRNPISAKEMLAYRDQVVASLKEELDLLNELHAQGIFDKDKGIFTTENYPEKVSVIEGEIKKLENFDVVLAVVGTMKAGKSTTINAIVGHEILPNRNRPMTALPTLIYHTPSQAEPKLTFKNHEVNAFVGRLQALLKANSKWCEDNQLQPDEMQALIQRIISGWVFEESYLGEEKIFEFLADLNDLVRLSETLRVQHQQQADDLNLPKDKRENHQFHADNLMFPFDACKNIDQLPRIDVAFRYLGDMKANEGQLILLDTPGPNEAGQEHLRPILEEQLRRCSAVLLVLDYTQLKSEASNSVKEQIEAIPTISADRLFALVNKFDQKTANSDNEEATRQLIFNDFLKDKVHLNHIFPLASQHAFLANRMATELDTKGKPEWAEDKEDNWLSDFMKIAFGVRMKPSKWQAEEVGDIREVIEEIVADSKVQAPLQEAIMKTQLEAPRIALQAALTQLKDLLKDVGNFCHISLGTASKTTQEEIEQLQATLDGLERQIEKLKKLQEAVEKNIQSFNQKERAKVEDKFKELVSSLDTKVNNLLTENLQDLNKNLNEAARERRFKWFKWMSNEEFERYKQAEHDFKRLIQLNEGNELTFNKEGDVTKLQKSLNVIYSTLIRKAASNVQDMLKESTQELGNKLSETEKEVKDIFDAIKSDFSRENIQLNLDTDTLFANSAQLHLHEVTLLDKFEQKNKKTKIEKGGFFSKVARFFGVGGYETEESTYFTFDKYKLQELFSEHFKKEFVHPAKTQITQTFEQINDAWVSNYIGTVRNEAQKLIDETRIQIEENTSSKMDKETMHTNVTRLLKRNARIQEDIQSVQDKFIPASK